MDGGRHLPSEPRPYSPECLERLSGKQLDGVDRAFVGSAMRRKGCLFTTFRRLARPRNGPCSEFPDSL